MQTEYLILDKCCEREIVEEIGEIFPDRRVAVLSEAFVIEAVDLSDLARFVVTTEDGDALRVSDLESDE